MEFKYTLAQKQKDQKSIKVGPIQIVSIDVKYV